jgi:hypothetical protein
MIAGLAAEGNDHNRRKSRQNLKKILISGHSARRESDAIRKTHDERVKARYFVDDDDGRPRAAPKDLANPRPMQKVEALISIEAVCHGASEPSPKDLNPSPIGPFG